MSPAATAFVQAGGAAACVQRASAFRGRVCESQSGAAPAPARRSATPKMLVEDGEVVPAKGSKWKENLFTGGIPGGEAFYKQWIDDGMKGEFADMPERLQPGKAPAERPEKPTPFLKRIDSMEFFSQFAGEGGEAAATEGADPAAPAAKAAPAKKPAAAMPSVAPAKAPVTIKIGGKSVSTAPTPLEQAPVVDQKQVQADILAAAMQAADDDADPEAPDEALFAEYFPKETRNLAPELSFVSVGDFMKDRVSLAMTEVTAKASDVYFPKEMSGKAPIIEIFYPGNVTTASISVKLDDVEPLPLPSSPAPGVAAAKMGTGAGGGLKLSFEVDGSEVSAYADPRCVEQYKSMIN